MSTRCSGDVQQVVGRAWCTQGGVGRVEYSLVYIPGWCIGRGTSGPLGREEKRLEASAQRRGLFPLGEKDTSAQSLFYSLKENRETSAQSLRFFS